MSASPIITVLASQSDAELELMHGRMRDELAKLAEQQKQKAMEMSQIEAAIAYKARRSGSKSGKRKSGSKVARPASDGPTTRQRISALLKEQPDAALSPADIAAALKADGWTGSSSAVHNALSKLVQDAVLEKVGEGRYSFASPNDAVAGAVAGPTENGHREPLSMVPLAQDGS